MPSRAHAVWTLAVVASGCFASAPDFDPSESDSQDASSTLGETSTVGEASTVADTSTVGDTTAGRVCGDGVVDPGETCDGAPPMAAFCVDCMIVCHADRHDCDGDVSNGCETPVGPDDCSACDEPCEAVQIAINTPRPQGIVADATALYWVDEQLGDVLTVPLDGGGETTALLEQGAVQLRYIAITPTDVFASDVMGDTVWRASKDGATTELFIAPAGTPTGLAVDVGVLYYASTMSGTIVRYPLPSGPGEALVPMQSAVTQVAVAGGFVHWIAGAAVRRAPVSGGDAQDVAQTGSPIDSFAFVADGIVFTEPAAGTVWLAPLDGSDAVPLVSNEVSPRRIAADADGIYWWSEGHGTLRRADHDGRNARVVALVSGTVGGITATADAIYWGDSGSQSISRIAKD